MSGAGVTINPEAFIVISQDNVKLLPVNHSSSFDKLLDYVPDLIEKASNIMNKCISNKKENANKETEEKKKTKETKETKEPKEKKETEYEFEYDETTKDELQSTEFNDLEDE